jgi:hypothetical protein
VKEIEEEIIKVTPEMVNELHQELYPNNEPKDLVDFSPYMKKSLRSYAKTVIYRVRDTSLDNTPGDDLEGYMYEALRINFVIGLAIGMKSRNKK